VSHAARALSTVLALLACTLMPAAALGQLGQEDEAQAASDDQAITEESGQAAEPSPEHTAATLAAPMRVTAVEPVMAAEPPPAKRLLAFQAAAGLGVGTLSFVRPTAAGAQKLDGTPFAATELLLRAHAWPANRLSLDMLLVYQTSFGLVLQVAPLFALPQNVDVRSQRVELSAAPVLRLGSGADAPALAFPIGFVFRSFLPEVHQFNVPKYSLAGPNLRAELLLELSELVHLRAGPELQWLVLVDGSLRREGACCQGASLGGQGSIEARVGPTFSVALAYRESHEFVPAGSWRFMDVERFLTARIAGEL
jgi:hypothetical protein